MLKTNIDDIDRRILIALQENGRATNHEISERVGLSPSPCLRRIRALEKNEAIQNYVALVNPEAIGLSVTAFVRVRLSGQDDRNLAEFESAVTEFPEVMECYLMSGEADYQLRVLVSSLSSFEDFLRQKLTRISAVSQVTSSFALRPIVYRTALPISS